jgi:hypothetical protein
MAIMREGSQEAKGSDDRPSGEPKNLPAESAVVSVGSILSRWRTE